MSYDILCEGEFLKTEAKPVLDEDLEKMEEAVQELSLRPTDPELRSQVSLASALLLFSARLAHRYYMGIYLESHARKIKEVFEKAIEVLSNLNDSNLRNVRARWTELQPIIERVLSPIPTPS